MKAAREANSRLGLYHPTGGASADVSSIKLFSFASVPQKHRHLEQIDYVDVGKNESLTKILDSTGLSRLQATTHGAPAFAFGKAPSTRLSLRQQRIYGQL